ncbi:MAG: hypothetical protein BWZ08_02603 [candidate division BRC1 bacterium ADurb.BinA292]|nr:MAG: hypothetical protein BWZ08_02603 [candidate division BRC1 bacterium ADurb.BinA292]
MRAAHQHRRPPQNAPDDRGWQRPRRAETGLFRLPAQRFARIVGQRPRAADPPPLEWGPPRRPAPRQLDACPPRRRRVLVRVTRPDGYDQRPRRRLLNAHLLAPAVLPQHRRGVGRLAHHPDPRPLRQAPLDDLLGHGRRNADDPVAEPAGAPDRPPHPGPKLQRKKLRMREDEQVVHRDNPAEWLPAARDDEHRPVIDAAGRQPSAQSPAQPDVGLRMGFVPEHRRHDIHPRQRRVAPRNFNRAGQKHRPDRRRFLQRRQPRQQVVGIPPDAGHPPADIARIVKDRRSRRRVHVRPARAAPRSIRPVAPRCCRNAARCAAGRPAARPRSAAPPAG